MDPQNTFGIRKNYAYNSIKNYKNIMAELDMMENCEEYQYKNSLNIFSITLGPFEKEPDTEYLNEELKIDTFGPPGIP